MYNEQLKLSFINFYTEDYKLQNHCKVIFEKLATVESKLNKDVSCFSLEESDEAISVISGFSGNTTRKALYTFKHYVRWCISNNVPGANEELLQINTADVRSGSKEGIERKLISSPLHLQSYLDAIFHPIDKDTIQNLYRLFFWLAYSGLTELDMKIITAENVVWDDMAIYVNNESFPIYREMVPALKSCMNLTHFKKYNPLYSKPAELPRSNNNRILRGTEGSKYDINKSDLSVMVRDAHKHGKIDFVLSYRNVWTSGIFYNAYECERAKIPFDFSRAVKQYFINKGVDPNSVDYLRRFEMNKKFMLDYNRWKDALIK